MRIQLSDHFTYNKIIRFTLPSMLMVMFNCLFSVIDDGLFISNFIGKNAFVAISLFIPLWGYINAVGFMFAAGGSALVAKTLGEGDKDKANAYFSLIIYTAIVLGLIFTVICFIFLRPICMLLGAKGEVLTECITYGRVIVSFWTVFMLQTILQSFLIVAEKPKIGTVMTFVCGAVNIIFDVWLIVVLKWGIFGAGLATTSGFIITVIMALIYFYRPNSSLLRLGKTKFELSPLLKTCSNGASEFLLQISFGIVMMLYNLQMLKAAGNDGVAAFGAVGYIAFIFGGALFGYSTGISPVISYNFGAKNIIELKSLFKKSLIMNGALGIILTVTTVFGVPYLAKLLIGYDENVLQMAVNGAHIYALSFLFMGFCVFGSNLFTALNDGLTAFVLSAVRVLAIQVITILTLPIFFGYWGVWWSVVVAEVLSALITAVFFLRYKEKYQYA